MNKKKSAGKVYLVGAGPGDPSLLTVRADRIIRQVDVILYDHLVTQSVLELIPPAVRKICVGKHYHHHSCTQDEIHCRITELALSGLDVCRLKGGDPFIFGRGGEEAIALQAAGIEYEIIPGITAAIGCSAYAGVPLTHRSLSRGVTLITGHLCDKSQELQWHSLATINHTLVFYMGLSQAGHIATQLISHGMAEHTPACIVSHGTQARQKVIATTLNNLEAQILARNPPMPALIIVGEVVSLMQGIDWFNPVVPCAAVPALRRIDNICEAEHV